MSDAVRFGARLGMELGRLGWARLLSDSRDVPSSMDELDAGWMSEALSTRFPGVRVEGLRVLGADSGTTERRRLELQYASGGRPEGAPGSLFVKGSPRGLTEQLFGNLFALGPNELGFYRDIRAELPIRAPQCFAALSGRSGAFALLLEDLPAEGAVLKTIADPLSLEEAEAVVDALGRLHAAYWGPSAASERFPWLRSVTRNRNAAVERFVCAHAHRPTLERFSDLLPASVRKGAATIHAKRRELERYWADAPLTLIHGDSHLGNMYFVGGEAGFFDWQVLQHNQGIRDLSYFLILSLDTELRRSHERELLQRYLDALREHGVREEEARFVSSWERYRSFSLYAYIATSVTTSMSDLQPEQIARLGLLRAATAVDDLDALQLLDRIA